MPEALQQDCFDFCKNYVPMGIRRPWEIVARALKNSGASHECIEDKKRVFLQRRGESRHFSNL